MRIQVTPEEYEAHRLDDEHLAQAVAAIADDGYVILGGARSVPRRLTQSSPSSSKTQTSSGAAGGGAAPATGRDTSSRRCPEAASTSTPTSSPIR
jgi:hypothetical protein